ncbi:predicted protein, partial [Nematostella vectensis]
HNSACSPASLFICAHFSLFYHNSACSPASLFICAHFSLFYHNSACSPASLFICAHFSLFYLNSDCSRASLSSTRTALCFIIILTVHARLYHLRVLLFVLS